MGLKDFHHKQGRADACLACVKSRDWSLAHKTNGTTKQNKQQNKAEACLLGDTLAHSVALHLGVGCAVVLMQAGPLCCQSHRMQHMQGCAADTPD